MNRTNSGTMPDSVRTADQSFTIWSPNSHSFVPHKPKTRESVPKPKLSLVEWFIIGPMVVGLGFMAGVMWP